MAEQLPTQPAQRERNVTVVTNDNVDEFIKSQLPQVAEEPVSEAPNGEKPDGKLDARDGDDETVIEIKKRPKIEARFSELTNEKKTAIAAKEAAEAIAKAERDAREQLQRERDELKAKYEPPKPDVVGPKPDPKDYEDVAKFSADLEEWTTEKTRLDIKKEAQAKADTERKANLAKTWNERQVQARKDIEDYDSVISTSTAAVSDEVRDAIVESEVGPQILYHLAQNVELADKIGQMDLKAALKAVGRLEAQLEKKPEQSKPSPVAQISGAPAPITPIKSTGGGNVPVDPYSRDMTYAQHKAARLAGKIK